MSLPKRNLAGEFNNFLASCDDYSPTIPEVVTKFYLERSGLAIKDERIPKVVSLAADKLISEILYEAKQRSKFNHQQTQKGRKKSADSADTIEIEDLDGCLKQMNIFVKRRKTQLQS